MEEIKTKVIVHTGTSGLNFDQGKSGKPSTAWDWRRNIPVAEVDKPKTTTADKNAAPVETRKG